MPKREFLMLAHTFKPKKYGIGGWYMSEKLDGMRCFWDGGLTRGMYKSDVPWANCEKDERYVTPPIATGLWSRYGNVIHAPNSYLDYLPRVPLDGELYIPDYRQELMSTVKALEPDPTAWEKVRYFAFDIPSFDRIFMDGLINVTNFKKRFVGIRKWIYEDTDISSLEYIPKMDTIFQSSYFLLQKYCTGDLAVAHHQLRLPFDTNKAIDLVSQTCDEISERGGEGLILRKAESLWLPQRSHDLLKVKKTEDAEGTVVGYITGRKTDKGSKLLGKMGALILVLDGGERLELSGFTDEERELWTIDKPTYDNTGEAWARANPECEVPDYIEAKHFPRGCRVTFKYRGKTRDGIPQEARYWRRREVE